MINASNSFKNMLYEGKRNYKLYADVSLKDGTQLKLTNSDIWQGSFSIEDAVSSDNKFDIGSAIINKLNFTINNIYGDFSQYDFDDAEIITYIGLELPDGTIEKLRKGTFAVDEPRYNGSTIALSCLDNMRLFDKAYSESKIGYPATLGEIIADACSCCGVSLSTAKFPNSSFVVSDKPNTESTTFREVISWCAQIAGCFARCDSSGKLELKWYDQEFLDIKKLDGGYYDSESENKYQSGDSADGGTFNPWNTGYIYDDGTFEDSSNYHHIYSYKSLSVSTDDVIITGVSVSEKTKDRTSGNEIATYTVGKKGYVVSIENNGLVTNGTGKKIADYLGKRLIGLSFRKASVQHLSDPTIEAGDVAYLSDVKENVYKICVSRTTFTTGGFQVTVSSAETPQKNSDTRYSAETKNYVETRKDIKYQISEYDKDVQNLSSIMANSMGMFTTVQKTENGGEIVYQHDKPNLSDSKIVWKKSEAGFVVSEDGGKTWKAGIDSSGNAVVNILSAIGIKFDWAKGGTLTLGGSNNTNGVLKIIDASGNEIGSWTKDGIKAAKGEFSGKITAKTGQIGGYEIVENAMYSEKVGMSSNTGKYAFWAGESNGAEGGGTSDSKFRVDNSGNMYAQNANIKGNVDATSGSFDSVTIKNSSVNSTNISGGTYSSGYISGGSLGGGTGGTYVGTCSGSSLSSCSLGGTSLSTGSGNAYVKSYSYGSTFVYGENGVYLSTEASIGGILSVGGNCKVNGGLSVTGSKNRLIPTKNFGERCLNAFETPLPTFSDFGNAKLDDYGECHILIDPIFAETVDKDYFPIVYLTKYGQGDIWVEISKSTYGDILIKGTPCLEFAWETRYRQINSTERLLLNEIENTELGNRDFVVESEVDYETGKTNHEANANEYLKMYNICSIDYSEEGYNYYTEFEGGLV